MTDQCDIINSWNRTILGTTPGSRYFYDTNAERLITDFLTNRLWGHGEVYPNLGTTQNVEGACYGQRAWLSKNPGKSGAEGQQKAGTFPRGKAANDDPRASGYFL
jgi:hypothetical protein